jgi:ATP-binding cassette, subfamily B, bacterial PglK
VRYILRIFAIIDRRIKIGLVVMLGLMLVSAALEMVGVGIFLPLLQLLVDPSAVAVLPVVGPMLAAAAENDLRGFLIAISAATLIIFVIKSIAMAVFVFAQNRFVLNAQAAFGRDLLRVYLHRPYVFHLQRNSAELIRNIQILSVRLFIKGVLPLLQIGMELIVGIGIFAVLMLVNPWATVGVALLLGCSVGLFYWLIQSRVRVWGELTVRYDGEILQWTQQALGSIKATKLSGNQEFFANAVAGRSFERARVLTLLNTAPYLPRLFIEVAAVAGLLALVVSSLAIDAEGVRSVVPVIGLFAAAAARLMPGFSKIVSNLTLLRENMATIDILYDDLGGKPPAVPAVQADRAGPAFTRDLRLSKVTFSYPTSPAPVLADIELAIRPGESIAFVGKSGSGKTTLADIILGLLEPSRGQVLIDGQDLAGNVAAWQRRVGYIPQDIYLLDDTLRRNIGLGLRDDEIDPAKIDNAVRLARLDSVVAALPRGLDAVIGERGVRLSGGQRQRIGIARALYNDPDVLIMDEATSALDAETEREISDALLSLRAGPTVIVIAHRLSTVRHCDRLVFLENGRIVDVGSFDELLARNKDFRRLAGVSLESLVP